MGVVPEVIQIGVCALISAGAVVGAVVVWRDDHKWLERHQDAEPVSEPSPYPLDLHELTDHLPHSQRRTRRA